MNTNLSSKRKNLFALLKKIFAYLLSAIVLINIIMWAVLLIYNDDVKSYFVARLNQQLNTKVEIDEVELAFWSTFPHASIELKNVRMHHGSPYKAAGYFLKANRIMFSFGWMDFVKGEYTAKAILAEGGEINVLSDSEGRVNYNVIKQDVKDEDSSFKFEIEQLSLRNMELTVGLVHDSFFWKSDVTNAEASGAFGESAFNLSLEAEFRTRKLESGDIIWINDKACELACKLQVNQEKHTYTFTEGDVIIAQTQIGVDGKVISMEDGVNMDLVLSGEELDIASFISLLPQEYSKYTNDYKSSGKFYANAEIKGEWDKTRNPLIKISFGINDGNVIYKPNEVALSDISIKGEFTNGQRRNLKTSMLKMSDFTFRMKEGITKGSLLLSDFTELLIDSRFTSDVDLKEIASFFPEGKVQGLQGKARLEMKVSGSVEGLSNKDDFVRARPDAVGTITFSNAAFRIAGDTLGYRSINSRIRFNRQDVLIEQLSGFAGSTDFTVDGRFENFFGYLFSDNQPIGIAAHVQCRQINLDELVSKTAESSSAEGRYNLKISPRLSLRLNMRVEKLKFRRFKASAISGKVDLNNQIVQVRQVGFKTMEGSVSLEGSIDSRKSNDLVLNCTGNLKGINVNQLFYQFENFGQKVITDQNLMGKLNSEVDLKMFMDSSLNVDTKRVHAEAFLKLDDGRLVNFEPLNNLSKFISLAELKDVRFSSLQNTIEIKNEQVFIPRMEITSSALDIFVSGKHGFDNQIDYHFQVTMSDLLSRKAKKAKKENEEFGEITDDGLGRTQLFISMTGPVDNPKISYDSRGAREKLKTDIQEEKQTLKKILNKEFGLFKKDSTLNKQNEEIKKKKKPGVIIEFDE